MSGSLNLSSPAGIWLHIKSQNCMAKTLRFKCFQKLSCSGGIRMRSRSTNVDCCCGNSWKNGPFGAVWQAEDIAEAIDGEVVASGPAESISTDSRRIKPGEWFLPLLGPNFDGHQFLQQALESGCAGYIGRAVQDWPRGFIRVENDSIIVLHRLATWVRRRFGGAVVGITGSTGKTTARAMTALALESLGTIHQTEEDFNNHVGLPLTLLKLPSTSTACVLEMGMNHPGEIQALAEIARPHVRVVLNVGPAHMENFESQQDVAAAKAELFMHARPGDICILNADDPLVMNLALPQGVQVVLLGRTEGCHLKISNAQATKGGRAIRVVLEQFHPARTWVENFNSRSQILKHLRDNSTNSNTPEFVSASITAKSSEISNKSNLLQRNDTNESCSSSNLKLDSRAAFEIPSPGLHLALNACLQLQ